MGNEQSQTTSDETLGEDSTCASRAYQTNRQFVEYSKQQDVPLNLDVIRSFCDSMISEYENNIIKQIDSEKKKKSNS